MLSSLEHIVVVVVLFIAFHRISSQCAATASRTARWQAALDGTVCFTDFFKPHLMVELGTIEIKRKQVLVTVRSKIWFVNLLELVKLLAYIFIVQFVGGLVCLWDCIEASRTSLTECWRASSAAFDSHGVRCQFFARCNSNDSSIWLASDGHWKISTVWHCYWLVFATSESIFASQMGLFV